MRRAVRRLALVALLVLPAALHAHSLAVARFGMLGNSEAWPWMSAASFNAQRALGNQFARIDIVWNDLQRADGSFDFTVADRRFADVERGQPSMRAIPTIYVGRGWMTCTLDCDELFRGGTCEPQATECRPQCGCCQRCPQNPSASAIPEDLATAADAEPDPAFGYSRSYYEFVRAFVERYRERLEYVVIENEANNGVYWDIGRDPDNLLYLRLLATATKAAHDVQPNIRVVDSGLVSTFLGLCIAKHWIESGNHTAQETYDMVRELTSYVPNAVDPVPGPAPPLDSPAQLEAFLRGYEDCGPLYNLAAQAPSDVWNFHYYESPRTVRVITDYFREMDLEFGRPVRHVITNELSCRPQRGATLEDEARCLFQQEVAAQSLGLSLAVWYSVWGHTGTNVWDADGSERPAARSHRLLATTLGGRYAAALPPAVTSELVRSYFIEPNTGSSVIEIVWSNDDAAHEAIIEQPEGYALNAAVDYLGRPVTLVPAAPRRFVATVSADPILVRWDAALGPTPTPTLSRSPTPTPTETPPVCAGDCDGDGTVRVDELVRAVAIALGAQPLQTCRAADADADGSVSIGELVRAVGRALEGCAVR